MKKVLICCLLLGWFSSVLGQAGMAESDSLGDMLLTQLRMARSDTARITLLLRLSNLRRWQGKSDSAKILLIKGLQLAQQSRHPLYLGRAYGALSDYYDQLRKPQLYIAATQKSIYFLQKAGQVPAATRAMSNLAREYAVNFQQAKSVEQCQRNLAYAQQTGHYEIASESYALLYTIHMNFGQKKKAFADLMGMKEMAERYPTTGNKYFAYANLADWYDHQKDYTRALLYWKRVSTMDRKNGDPLAIVESYHSIAANLIELKELGQAEEYMEKALLVLKRDQPVSANIYVTLARLREAQSRLPEARQAALTALANARQTFQPFIAKTSLEVLARIQEKLGKFQEALLTTHQLKAVSDSIDGISHLRAINDVESRFALEKKEKDIKVLRQDAQIQKLAIERAQQQRILYTGLAVSLTLLLLLMGWTLRQDRRNLRILNEQKTEIMTQATRLKELNRLKDKLLLLIGHDLRSPVINLKMMIERLSLNTPSSENFGQQTERLQRIIDSLYYTLDNLLHWASTQKEGMIVQREPISPRDAVDETLDLFEAMIRQKEIRIEVNVPPQAEVSADEGQLQVVVRNVLHNALKFTPAGGLIRISLDHITANETVLRIADSGIGMDIQKVVQTAGTAGEKGTGLGLLVCQEFMEQNGGRMEISSSPDHGTTVQLIFSRVERTEACVIV